MTSVMPIQAPTPKPLTEERKHKLARKHLKVRLRLQQRPEFAFFWPSLHIGKVTLEEHIPTACTNGRDEMYGYEFIDSQTEKALAFTYLHENLHKLCKHMEIYKALYKKHGFLANVACDHWINITLHDLDPHEQFLSPPRNPDGTILICMDFRFRGMSVKQIFDILYEEHQCPKGKGKGKGEGEGQDEGKGNGGGGGEDSFDQHDWEGASNLPKEEKDKLADDINRALEQGAFNHKKLNGTGGGNLDALVDEITSPRVDWREPLREFFVSTCLGKDMSSWQRVNRRFIGDGLLMPTLVGETVGEILIGADLSGSIWANPQEMRQVFSEIVGILEMVAPEKVHLLYWDGEVQAHEQYTQDELDNFISSTRPSGGGGTSPSCVTKYMEEKQLLPECVVMLTDGYVGTDWGGNWPCPVLWGVINNPTTAATTGKTLHISLEELDQ